MLPAQLLPTVAGIAQGVSIGVLSGVTHNAFFISYFENPSDEVLESLVGMNFIGALFGCLLGGHFADTCGRRPALISGTALVSVGCALAALPLISSTSLVLLFMSRAIIGLGFGVVWVVVIIYLAETASSSDRGTQEATFQLAAAVGILMVYALSYQVLPTRISGWKVCLASQLPPALLLLIVVLMLPESPRWLAMRGDLEGARRELGNLRGTQLVEEEMSLIIATCKAEPMIGWLGVASMLTQKNTLMALAMMAWFPLTGIDIITQYAPEIFGESDRYLDGAAKESQDLVYTIWVGLALSLASLVPIFTIDTLGRRPLLTFGGSCLVGSLACLAVVHSSGLKSSVASVLQVAPVLTFIVGFGAIAPVFLVLPVEVLETNVRAKIIALSWAVMNGVDYIVTASFLTLRQTLGLSGTFALYLVFNLLFGTLIWIHAPETLGCELDAECTKKLTCGLGNAQSGDVIAKAA